MVDEPGAWPWSSYRAMVGEAAAPKWLATDALLAQFGSRRIEARERYRQFVSEGRDLGSIWSGLRQQMYLGSEAFVERVQEKMELRGDELSIPKALRRAPTPPLSEIEKRHPERDDAIVAAYATGTFSYREIGEYFGLHLATIGRIIRRHRPQRENSILLSG